MRLGVMEDVHKDHQFYYTSYWMWRNMLVSKSSSGALSKSAAPPKDVSSASRESTAPPSMNADGARSLEFKLRSGSKPAAWKTSATSSEQKKSLSLLTNSFSSLYNCFLMVYYRASFETLML